MIKFYCKCGQKIGVRDEHAGKRAKCPRCKQIVKIPDANPATVSGPQAGFGSETNELDSMLGDILKQEAAASKSQPENPPELHAIRAVPQAEHVLAQEAQPTKQCPYCAETILATARKCKHCGEFLDQASRPAPSLREQPAGQRAKQQSDYSGIGRLGYFLGSLGLGLLSFFLSFITGTLLFWLLSSALLFALFFVLAVYRLRNVGMNGWWSLLALVPVANILIGVRCLICPEGYHNTRTMDTAGKVIAGIIIGFCVLGFGTVLLGAVLPVERLFVADRGFDPSPDRIAIFKPQNAKSLAEFVLIAKQIRTGISEGITFADLTEKQTKLRDAYAVMDRQAVPESLVQKAAFAYEQVKELREIWRKDIYESEYVSWKDLLQKQMSITGDALNYFLAEYESTQ